MPSLPATIFMQDAIGGATIVQALERAVWPVPPIGREATRVSARTEQPVPLGRQRACGHLPRADHQHIGFVETPRRAGPSAGSATAHQAGGGFLHRR